MPPPGDLPNPGMEPSSFMSPALAGKFLTTSATWEAPKHTHIYRIIQVLLYTHIYRIIQVLLYYDMK